MAKFFVALLVVMTMSICSSLTPLDQLKAIVQSDTCTLDKVEALKPQIQKQVDRLKQVLSRLKVEPERPRCQGRTHPFDPEGSGCC